jgi:hypothetical protein
VPSIFRTRKPQVSKITQVHGIPKAAGGVIIHGAAPTFFIRINNNIKIPKNKPVRIIISEGEIINKFKSEILIRAGRITINASSTPHLIMSIDKKINIIEIMHFYINIKITIVPEEG